MKIQKKIVITLFVSVLSIAVLNIAAFYVFYLSFIKVYLSEKIESRQTVTIDYINNLIKRDALNDVDELFSDVELQFFELLDVNNGKIPLENEENIGIVVDFLAKSGVSPSLIEEVIPENSLEKVLNELETENSPESRLVKRILFSIILFNLGIFLVFGIIIAILTRKIVIPIQKASEKILALRPGKENSYIEYSNNDEIGLLIRSINSLNKKLSVQEKIRSQLLADISHELKTPITSIQCYLEGIIDGIIPLDEQNFQSIVGEMSRLIELVNKIMEYERFDTTTKILEKTAQKPSSILSKVIETMKANLDKNNQKVLIQGNKDVCIFMDENLFMQLSYNIVGNFLKYAGVNSTLHISISHEKISFQDNGNGISKKEVEFIFEKFYQGKKEKTGDISQRGIGIGLSLVKRIVELHDWKMQAQSDEGKGFLFEIYL